MRLADQYLLARIREELLSHVPEEQWNLVEQEVEKVGGVREVGGYAGTLIRDAMMSKASFGGDRSAAGRYAAEQRWKGHTKGQASPETKARITAQARAAAEAKTKFPGVRTVITGEPASPSREQQREFNRFVKLNDERRSLERDIEYTESQLKEMERRMSEHTPNPELDAQARRISLNNMGNANARLQRTLSNLQTKLDAVNAQIEKEFPAPNQSAEPNGTAVPKAQPSDTPESNIQNIDQRIKEAKAQLEEVKYDPMQYRQRRIIELRIKRLQEVKREQGAKIKIKTLTESKEAQPKRENIDADKKLVSRNERGEANIRGQNRDTLERQVNTNIKALEDIESGKLTPYKWGQVKSKKVARESLLEIISRGRASLAAIDEFEDETSPGYFAS